MGFGFPQEFYGIENLTSLAGNKVRRLNLVRRARTRGSYDSGYRVTEQ
jgi:hypothetical protein